LSLARLGWYAAQSLHQQPVGDVAFEHVDVGLAELCGGRIGLQIACYSRRGAVALWHDAHHHHTRPIRPQLVG